MSLVCDTEARSEAHTKPNFLLIDASQCFHAVITIIIFFL